MYFPHDTGLNLPLLSAHHQVDMSVSFGTIWTQHFPPAGPLTEANLPNQTGKVFIVTGGSNGIGYELSRQLYGAGGKVYILTRSKERTESAISKIKAHYEAEDAGKQRGSLDFIRMDFMDFDTVKTAAQDFLSREGPNGRLDILSVHIRSHLKLYSEWNTEFVTGSTTQAQEPEKTLLPESRVMSTISLRMFSDLSF